MNIKNNAKNQIDVIIIGAGAAGLMCAARAAANGCSVMLIEHGKKIGAKILISGGGRCNFTNMDAGPNNYLSSNPHFMKSALKRYTPWDFISLISSYGLTYTEKKLGQLFCDQGSKAIVEVLQKECDKAGVVIKLNTTVTGMKYHPDQQAYQLSLNESAPITAKSVVIATGGLSIPKMGATGFAYDIARQFNLDITNTSAALVPFTFQAKDLDFMKGLTGVAIDAIVSYGKASFRENILFTHRGLSGPAILQISSYWDLGQHIQVNLLPDENLVQLLTAARQNKPKTLLANYLCDFFPSRFAKAFTEEYLPNKPLGQMNNKDIELVSNMICNWTILPAGTEGYRTAEVTKGGIDPAELSSKTMQANKQSGLYFIGESVDVTGWLGGYNFQWAWASAAAAAEAISGPHI